VPVKIRPSVLFEAVIKTSYAYTFGVVGEWGGSGSNRRPADYESQRGLPTVSLVGSDFPYLSVRARRNVHYFPRCVSISPPSC
jgi:hypothetical protein